MFNILRGEALFQGKVNRELRANANSHCSVTDKNSSIAAMNANHICSDDPRAVVNVVCRLLKHQFSRFFNIIKSTVNIITTLNHHK